MNMPEIVMLGAILAGLAIVLLALRVPSFVAFFSLLIGQLLATQSTNDVYDFAGSIVHLNDSRYVQIALLFLPVLLTILFLRGRVAKSKLVIEFIPALFVAATALVLLYPLVPEFQSKLDQITSGRIQMYQTAVIIAASISGLLSAWMSYPKPAHGKHEKH